jgi:hypothetical protein
MNPRRALACLIVSAMTVVLPAGTAGAHPDRPHGGDPTPEPTTAASPESSPVEADEMPGDMPGDMPGPHQQEGPEAAELILAAPDRAEPGTPVRLEAVLRDAHGQAVAGATIEFVTSAAWGEWLRDEVVLAIALTDSAGRAAARVDLRAPGNASVEARFAGDGRLEPARAEAVITVATHGQAVRPQAGIAVPSLTVGWLIGLVALVWFLFLVVAFRVFAIARAGEDSRPGRRRFLGRYLAPVGIAAVAASLGSGLIALISRSPRTHANLGAVAEHTRAGHRLPPIARLGEQAAPQPLPLLLDREVSFAHDVMPILRAKGGPHAHPPAHSPAPHGIRLDSYDAIMGTPGLVEPGRPADSRLVTVLLDPAVRMPPSVPPLPDEEIRLIASWVAQGARDN